MARKSVDDVVVVVPGILGSRLSREGREVWGTSVGAGVQALITFGNSLNKLRLPDGIGDGDPDDGVVATGLMEDLQIVPGLWSPVRAYSGLMDWLRERFTLDDRPPGGGPPNLVPFAYDWRLSNRLTAERLRDTVEPALERWRDAGHPDAKLVFLCHSMGGLVTRHYLERLGGAGHARALVTFGTPHRGALKALTQIVNEKSQGWWKWKVDLTALVRSLPAAYQLLPTYACIDAPNREDLLRLDEADVPDVDSARLADALDFHREMAMPPEDERGYRFEVVTGTEQPTTVSARVRDGNIDPLPFMKVTADGKKRELIPLGDETVPLFSAEFEQPDAVDANRMWQAEQHGSLHLNRGVQEQVMAILTDDQVVFKAIPDAALPSIGIDVPDVVAVGEPVEIQVRSEHEELRLEGVIAREGDAPAEPIAARSLGGGSYSVPWTPAAPGAYEVQVRASFEGREAPTPVTGAALAWADEVAS